MFDGKCFLCQSNCLENETTSGMQSGLLEFSKHVKMFLKKDESIDFTLVCEQCQILLRTFRELLKSLEIAEMKVDFCVKQIHDLMLQEDHLKSQECDYNVSGIFRKRLIEKSSLHLKRSRSQPFVKVFKTKARRISSSPVSKSLSAGPLLGDPGVEIVKIEPEEEEEMEARMDLESAEDSLFDGDEVMRRDNGSVCNSADKSEKTERTFQEEVNKIAEMDTKNEGAAKNLTCPFCRAEFQETRISQGRCQTNYGVRMLRRHLLHYHCEHYFPTQRLNSVTDHQYRKIIAELLFKDLVDGRTSCEFCEKSFRTPSKFTKKSCHILSMKLHYIEDHFQILEETLKAIQEDPNLAEELYKCNPKGRVCECGVYISNSSGWRVHNIIHCNLTGKQEFFVPKTGPNIIALSIPVTAVEKNSKNDVRKVKCELCGIIVNRGFARKHLKLWCKGRKENDLTTDHSAPETEYNVTMEVDIEEPQERLNEPLKFDHQHYSVSR